LSCDTDTPWFGDQLSETGDTLKVAAPRRIAPITVSFFMMFLQQQGFIRYEDFAPWAGDWIEGAFGRANRFPHQPL
jgi:hypothetical protein